MNKTARDPLDTAYAKPTPAGDRSSRGNCDFRDDREAVPIDEGPLQGVIAIRHPTLRQLRAGDEHTRAVDAPG